MNINHLGEAVLSEAEAERRLGAYLEDLKDRRKYPRKKPLKPKRFAMVYKPIR